MCPYAVVSLQKSIGGSDPQKPFPQTQTPERVLGGRGERGLGHWMYESSVNVTSDNGVRHVRSLTMRRPDVPWGASGDEEPNNPNVRWLQPPYGRAPRKPQGAIFGGNLGKKGAQSPAERSEQEQRVPYRSKAPRAGKNHDVSRRRGGSGLGGSGRIGETNTRTAKKARTGIERESRQGCQRHDRPGE